MWQIKHDSCKRLEPCMQPTATSTLMTHANIVAVCTHVLCTDCELYNDCHCTDCTVSVTYDCVLCTISRNVS